MFFDIETTDLDGDFGNMLAFGYKWAGQERASVISLLDTSDVCGKCGRVDAIDDKALVKAAWDILSEADIWCTWFGKGFDAKFLNTRILDAKLPPLPPVPHIDLYFAAKCHLKLTSNRLASVQDFLRLPTSKTPLTKRVWRRAQAGHVPSIKYVITHCRADVQVLDEAHDRLKAYVRQHPPVGEHGACRMCGADELQRRGRAVSQSKTQKYRYVCTTCGAWETR